MPKARITVIPGDGVESDELPPIERARISADAMYRAALDTWHHHDRLSRLVGKPTLEAEQRIAREMCRLCDEGLTQMLTAYESVARKLQPSDAEAAWWHKANALWHAAREYLRRHAGCDRLTTRIGEQSPDTLGELLMEFDLEASAVLALRQAAEAYRNARPGLVT